MSNETTAAQAKAERGKAHRARNEAEIKQFAASINGAMRAQNDSLIESLADALGRAEAAEADRDRLVLELAAMRGVAAKATNALGVAAKGSAGAFDVIAADADRQRARAERAEAEVAALRGAMPDPEVLEMMADEVRSQLLRDYAAAIRALSATPPAAEAVTGAWTRTRPEGKSGWRWVVALGGMFPKCALLDGVGMHMGRHGAVPSILYGPAIADPPDGWREALAALDQPQEATDGV